MVISIFDWLGDILGGIGSAVGGVFDTIGEQVSAAIWDAMIRWFYNTIFDAASDFFMMNGTMFAGLQEYVQEDFCKAHPVVEFQTADGCAEYQMFAVAWVKSNDDWYKAVNLSSVEDFNNAVERITSKALFQVGSSPEFGTQILTLSTCYDSAHNGRLLILAAKI